MTKTVNKKQKQISNTRSIKIQPKKIFTSILIIITLGSIIVITSLVFFPDNQTGFSELSLLTYDGSTGTYIADNYPNFISRTINSSIFFVVKNYENKIAYYQLQIKATTLEQNLSLEYPLPLSACNLMFANETLEKILSPASKKEKEEHTLTGQYIWGPVNTILFMNSTLDSILTGYDNLKIVFELWKFDFLLGNFQYTGVFTFLEFVYGW